MNPLSHSAVIQNVNPAGENFRNVGARILAPLLSLLILWVLSPTPSRAETKVFSHTGSAQTFVVPYDVTSIQVKLWGGGGGSGDTASGRGGGGAFVSGTLAVTPGETLTIIAAGGGASSSSGVANGGFGGGGNSGTIRTVGGGGGRSAIQRTVGTDLATAAGGGGGSARRGGSSACGAGGAAGVATGSNGTQGTSTFLAGFGRGASSSAGGASGGASTNGGNGSAPTAGTAGSQYQGGTGGNGTAAGGGGGGGYYGGGGGGGATDSIGQAAGGGGGGGSSYSSGLTGVTSAAGSNGTPGGTGDANYLSGIGAGATTLATAGGPGRVVLIYPAPIMAVEEPIGTNLNSGGSRAFGSVNVGSSADLVFTIRNTGTAALGLTGTPKVAVGGSNPADFIVAEQPATAVAASGSSTFTARFAPSSGGSKTALLTITSDDPDHGTFTISLTGTAIPVPVVTTPTSASVTGITATLGGNVTGDNGLTVTERGVVFSKTSDDTTPTLGEANVNSATGTGTTGVFVVGVSGLTPGTAYSFAAYATNSAGTGYTTIGTFTTKSDNADLALIAPSAGTLSPLFSAAVQSYTVEVLHAVNSITLTPTTADPNATVTVNGGSPAAAVSLVTGDNLIPVEVTAEDGTTQKTYEVTVHRNAPPEIAISGNGMEIASGDTTPVAADGTDFGSVNVTGTSVSRPFTIANTGTGDLILSGTPRVAISGTNAADFSVSPQPISPVTPGGSTIFSITFDPSAVATRTATVTVASDDADEGTYTFEISGTGVANQPPVVTVDGDPLTVTVLQGTLATATGTFSDANGNETVTLTASRGAVVKNPGIRSDTTSGGAWRTASVAKPLDGDADNIYGTDGYAMYGLNGVPTEVNPSYATVAVDPSVTFFPGIGGYTYIDDPANPTGPQVLTGVYYNGPGDHLPTTFLHITFTQARTVRIGVLIDNADYIDISPETLRLRQTAGGSYDTGHVPVGTAVTRNQSSDWYFFDVQAQAGDVYELSGNELPPYGSNGIGGIVFDTLAGGLPPPVSSTWTWTETPTTAPETDTVTITATDTANATGTASFALVVNPAIPGIEVDFDGVRTDGQTTPVADFGTTFISFPVRLTLIVTNPGTDTLIVQQPTLPAGYRVASSQAASSGGSSSGGSGGNAPFPRNVVPGDSTFIDVYFDPAVSGTYAGDIVIPSNAPGDLAEFSFAITGEALAPQPFTVELDGARTDGQTTPVANFGPLPVGGSESRTLIIANPAGNPALTISSVEVPAGFRAPTVGSQAQSGGSSGGSGSSSGFFPRTIAAGDTLFVDIFFEPTATGLFSGTLVIRNNQPGNLADFTFAIQGSTEAGEYACAARTGAALLDVLGAKPGHTLLSVSGATGGTAVKSANKVKFTLTDLINGGSFSYTARDGTGQVYTKIVNVYPPRTGTTNFVGLLANTSDVDSGRLRVTVSAGRGFSGTLLLMGRAINFTGTLDNAVKTLPFGFPPMTLVVGPPDASGQPTLVAKVGSLYEGVIEQALRNTSAYAGRYTLAAVRPDGATTPVVCSALTCQVTSTGNVTLLGWSVGGLGGITNKTMTYAGNVLSGGRVPFYSGVLRNGVHSLAGTLTLPDVGATFADTLRWTLPPGGDPRASGGFAQDYNVIGGRYTPSGSGLGMLVFNSAGAASLTLDNPRIRPSTPLIEARTVSGNMLGRYKLMPNNGTFNGSYQYARGKALISYGVVLQGVDYNYGIGILNDLTSFGTVHLTPAP